jgi:hypothetical protein
MVFFRKNPAMKVFLLMPLISLAVACTSFNKLDYYKEVELSSILENGDKVLVTLQNGDSHYMQIVSMSDENLVGTLLQKSGENIVGAKKNPGQGITIDVKEIAYIEVETIDGAKTTLAIAGGIVLLPIAILGLFLGAAANGM